MPRQSPHPAKFTVDIDSGLLEFIAQKAKKEKIENIQAVEGEFSDAKLPARDMDLAFFHDVLHHIEKRQAYLKALATYMKPSGRIALIDGLISCNALEAIEVSAETMLAPL